MKDKIKLLIDQYDKGGFTYSELEWELLNLLVVGVPFYCGGHNGSDRCKEQCHGCENDEAVN